MGMGMEESQFSISQEEVNFESGFNVELGSNLMNRLTLEEKVEEEVAKYEEHEKVESVESNVMDQHPSLEEVEGIIGYKFNTKALLREALTDKSYNKNDDARNYERLEYLGDSVLSMSIAKQQYFDYPDLTPGEWTPLRAANVDTEKLARVALKLNLHKYSRHNKRMLSQQIREFKEGIAKYPLHSFGLIDAPKVLADIVESTIGAVFVDTNFSFDLTGKVVKDMLQPMITPETFQKNSVTRLLEACQRIGSKVTRELTNWEKTGKVEYIIDDEIAGIGCYKSKKLIAVNRAAASAYDNYIMRNKDLGQKILGIGGLSSIC